MRTFGKMPVDWLMWTVLGYLEDIESNIHQIIWFKNAEFLYFESFVDIGCLCKVYGISIYINLCCHVLINPLASCWENLEIFLWKVLWIKSTAISKLTQNDPLPNRLMRIEPEETMWVHDISIKKNNWPASCVEIACLNHLGLKIISIQRLKHVYQILDIIKVWIIINQPASSKWPFDHPNRGHLTREKGHLKLLNPQNGSHGRTCYALYIYMIRVFFVFRAHFWWFSFLWFWGMIS